MTGTATVYNRKMTERGNKEKTPMLTYSEPGLFKKFKALCAIEGIGMTNVIEEFMLDAVELTPKYFQDLVKKAREKKSKKDK